MCIRDRHFTMLFLMPRSKATTEVAPAEVVEAATEEVAVEETKEESAE